MRLPVAGAPAAGSEYSMPVPGVAMKAVSLEPLTPVSLELVNTTPADITIDTSRFVGQSVRVTQRVALGGVEDGGAGLAVRLVEVLRLLEIGPLKELQALLQRSIDAYGDRPDATALDWAAAQVATLLNQFLLPVSVLDVIPLAGQAGKLCQALGKGVSRLNRLERGVATLAKEATSGLTHAAEKGVALDTNAIIARLEGAPADVQAVVNAMGGRTPQVSITAVKEFLRGGGDVNELRIFLQCAGGGVGKVPSAATVQQLESLGLKAADARVVGSAIEDGVNVLTRDKKILNKVPGAAEKF